MESKGIRVEPRDAAEWRAFHLAGDVNVPDLIGFLREHCTHWQVSIKHHPGDGDATPFRVEVHGLPAEPGDWLVRKAGNGLQIVSDADFHKQFIVPKTAQLYRNPWVSAGKGAVLVMDVPADAVDPGLLNLFFGPRRECSACNHASKAHTPSGCWANGRDNAAMCPCKRSKHQAEVLI